MLSSSYAQSPLPAEGSAGHETPTPQPVDPALSASLENARALVRKGMPITSALWVNWQAALGTIQRLNQRGQYPGLDYQEEDRALRAMTTRAFVKGTTAGILTWGGWWLVWKPYGGLSFSKSPLWAFARLLTIFQGFRFAVDHELANGIVLFENVPRSIVLDHVCPLTLEYRNLVSADYLRVCENYNARALQRSAESEESPVPRPSAVDVERHPEPAIIPSRSPSPNDRRPAERPAAVPDRPGRSSGGTVIREDADGVLRIDSR